MHLLSTHTYTGLFAPGHGGLKLTTFEGDIPEYAILSHRWGIDEIVFQDIQNGTVRRHRKSYNKVINAIRQAARDGIEHIWIDSCCIDKSSSVELQEAINSMYAWYQKAKICYAILDDVPDTSDVDFDAKFVASKWFTRGWTLQELLAPKQLRLFGETQTGAWKLLGSREELCSIISKSTFIHPKYLTGQSAVHQASIAQRMSWAAKRETTRGEDMAYALLGLFSVNMPMLYGEGKSRAFRRLQEEVMKISDDQSIFAWMDVDPKNDGENRGFESIGECHFWKDWRNEKVWQSDTELVIRPPHVPKYGLLADNPGAFAQSGLIEPLRSSNSLQVPYLITNRGLSICLNITSLSRPREGSVVVAELECFLNDPRFKDNPAMMPHIPIGVYLLATERGANQYARVRCNKLVTFVDDDLASDPTPIFVRQPRT